ncbi:hypothetical protein ON010_g7338 [Phytophthora cinnamomi]|nr:hypothetical protein ON010_g7338 [Phytophthora cinnamomi]
MYGIIRVQTSTDKSGVLLRVNKSGAMKVFKRWVARQFTRKGLADLKRWALKAVNTKAVQATRKTLSEMFHRIVPQPIREFFKSRGDTKREMADGFNVTIKYKDGRGEVEIPDTGKRFRVRGCRKTLMKADHVGLKPSMEESDILHNIFENTREVWEESLKELHAKHRDYRQRLAKIQEEESEALSDDFWFFVYNDAHLSRDDLEQYLLENESNPALQALPKTRKAALDALYLRKKWVFLHPQITFWYVFWDDVYARNSGFKCLKPEDFDPLHPTAICYHLKEEGELKNWLRERKLLRRWGLFHDGLLKLLYDGMKKYEKKSNTKAIEAFRPWKA